MDCKKTKKRQGGTSPAGAVACKPGFELLCFASFLDYHNEQEARVLEV
jgi:hypothetical protein